MTYSSHTKLLKQLSQKPSKSKRYEKYNTPKKRSCGASKHRCVRCLRIKGHISAYGLHLCRQCFREIATSIGFKQYS